MNDSKKLFGGRWAYLEVYINPILYYLICYGSTREDKMFLTVVFAVGFIIGLGALVVRDFKIYRHCRSTLIFLDIQFVLTVMFLPLLPIGFSYALILTIVLGFVYYYKMPIQKSVLMGC